VADRLAFGALLHRRNPYVCPLRLGEKIVSRIAIASIFRNSTSYLDRYMRQVADLAGHLCGRGFDIHLIGCEGDSTDDTWNVLKARMNYLYGRVQHVSTQSQLTLFKEDHGGQIYGSVDNPFRWANISRVCNKVLESVEEADDYLLYVESDLIWDADTMQYLLGNLHTQQHIDAVAPLCLHQPTGLFYDTWGHRKDGVPFRQHKPYHPAVGNKLTPIDSAGSCIAMRGEVARACRFTPPTQGIVGFGNDIRAKGYALYLDPQLTIYHP
jgi:hypothetical protein